MGKNNKNNNKTSNYTEFYYYFFRNILIVSLPLLIISALILGFAIPHSSARISSSDNLAISVPSSCTLSSSVDSEHSASIVNGRYEEGIGTTTLSTFCNDRNGYSVYAIGDSLDSEGNNVLVSDINNNYDIPSGIATSGDTSQWAMKLSLKTGDTSTTPPAIVNSFDNYSTVPTYWTRVATIPASTTDMVKGSNFTTTYATYISPTQAAGTYLGQVKYLLTHPSAATPTSAYIMQEVANWKNDLGEGESVQAIDIRDGKNYWVTKLKDGNVWMTQNLDLDIGGVNTLALTSENTDISTTASGSGAYADGYTESNGVWTWNPASTAITSGHSISGTSVSGGWSDATNYTTPYSAEGGDVYYYTSNNFNNDITYNSLTGCTQIGHTEGECKHYHRGNYYNWAAAIASNNSSTLTTQYINADNSICPKGWRLPVGNSEGNTNREFGELLATYNIISTSTSSAYADDGFSNIRKSPLWLVRSGYIRTPLIDSGVTGFYWSSTVSHTYNIGAYELKFGSGSISTATAGYDGYDRRGIGLSVRCIAR